jgi:aminoglycoside phosphotransferase (APT) family kinase protein
MVMKYGTEIQLSEASTLRFIAEKTSIPVPKVYCAFEYKGMRFILMERAKGKRIVDVWDKTPSATRELLLRQLKGYFEELRNIPHPRPGAVCGVDIGPHFDRRMDKDIRGFGPFANERDFNNFLRCGVTDPNKLIPVAGRFTDDKVREEVVTMIALQNKENHKIYFTHGDAHSRNFLVKGQKIVALIDFEMSGFYPEYWAYTTAMTTGNDTVYDD